MAPEKTGNKLSNQLVNWLEEWQIKYYTDSPGISPRIETNIIPPEDGQKVLIVAFMCTPPGSKNCGALCWASYNSQFTAFMINEGKHKGELYSLTYYYLMNPLLEMAVEIESCGARKLDEGNDGI